MHTRPISLPQSFDASFTLPDGDVSKSFRYDAAKPNGRHEGGIYIDEKGVKWLLKLLNPTDAVREVVASHIYRALVGEDAAPEVNLIKGSSSESWIVASKFNEALNPFNAKDKGVIAAFLASCAIGDRDCVSKNMASDQGKVFRYDFGAALRLTASDQLALKEATTLYEILAETGIDPLKILNELDFDKVQNILKKFANCQVKADFWHTVYEEACAQENKKDFIKPDEALSIQIGRVNDRMRYLAALAKPRTCDEVSQAVNIELETALIKFYEAIQPFVKPVISDYAAVMTKRHVADWQKHQKHPLFYQAMVKKAEDASAINTMSKQLQLTTNNSDAEECFYQQVIIHSQSISTLTLTNDPVPSGSLEPSAGALSKQDFKTAIACYYEYKNAGLGLRWLFASEASKRAVDAIAGVTRDKRNEKIIKAKTITLTDAERYAKAMDYIRHNENRALARELKKVMKLS